MKMRCYLIDPETQTISEMNIDPDDYDLKRKLLGCEVCSCIYPATDLIVWLDDEGLLREKVPALWQIFGYNGILAGKGLLVGMNRLNEGEHMPCPYTLPIVEAGITWRPHLEFIGLATTTGEEEHPIFGKMGVVRTEAKFRPKGN